MVSTIVSAVAIYILLEASLTPMLKAVDLVQRTGSGFNSPMPMMLKIGLVAGTVLYVVQLFGNLLEDVRSRLWRRVVTIAGIVLALRILALLLDHYLGSSALTDFFWSLFSPLEPLSNLGREMDIRSLPLSWVTVFIVAALLVLMMTGMPLGVATLTVSIFCALLYFGPRGCSWCRPTSPGCWSITPWSRCRSLS